MLTAGDGVLIKFYLGLSTLISLYFFSCFSTQFITTDILVSYSKVERQVISKGALFSSEEYYLIALAGGSRK